jgi:hypothetical protein
MIFATIAYGETGTRSSSGEQEALRREPAKPGNRLTAGLCGRRESAGKIFFSFAAV